MKYVLIVQAAIYRQMVYLKLFFCLFQVSWIRKNDLHILTMGTIVYTNDHRDECYKTFFAVAAGVINYGYIM